MIAPNTTVILLKGIPFDNTYEHTVSYANREAQFNDLTQGVEGDTKYTLSTMTYQRHTRNSIRVQMPVEKAFQCNYMCFRNTNYVNSNDGKGWIYAFITNVEYVNDVTSEIFYEIDVMQSFFLFDTVKEISFIEREHTDTDNIGDNITPEPLELGEYIFSEYSKLTDQFDDMSLIIGVTDIINDNEVDARVYDNNVSGETLYIYHVPEKMRTEASISGIILFLKRFIEKPEAITSMYLCPSYLVNDDDTIRNTIMDGANSQSLTKILPIFSGKDINLNKLTFNGYEPKNNKLYTYPYNYLHVDNGNGQGLSLRYEFFKDLQPKLFIYGNFTYPPSLNLVPTDYKGQSRETVKITTEKITIDNYPLSSWANDTYANWLATQRTPIMLGAISPLMQMATGLVTTTASVTMAGITGGASAAVGALGAGAGGLISKSMPMLNYITQTLSAKYTASIKADVLRGSTNIGNANIGIEENTFHTGRCHITAQYAEVIDKYFTMFGYAVNKFKEIEYRNNRENWTYIKTIGANLHGSCGNEYNKRMVDILDNGITFWKDSISKVCNYDLSNNPLGGN